VHCVTVSLLTVRSSSHGLSYTTKTRSSCETSTGGIKQQQKRRGQKSQQRGTNSCDVNRGFVWWHFRAVDRRVRVGKIKHVRRADIQSEAMSVNASTRTSRTHTYEPVFRPKCWLHGSSKRVQGRKLLSQGSFSLKAAKITGYVHHERARRRRSRFWRARSTAWTRISHAGTHLIPKQRDRAQTMTPRVQLTRELLRPKPRRKKARQNITSGHVHTSSHITHHRRYALPSRTWPNKWKKDRVGVRRFLSALAVRPRSPTLHVPEGSFPR